MTEKQIIKAWEDAKKYEFVPNERFIDETLELIRCKNAEIKNLSTENKQLQSDALIANQNYEHIKEIWEADKTRLSEKIREYIDKHNELITKEAAIRAEAVKELAEKTNRMITEIYNKHIFGNNDLEAEEKDAIINFSDDITYGFNNLVKEMAGADNAG